MKDTAANALSIRQVLSKHDKNFELATVVATGKILSSKKVVDIKWVHPNGEITDNENIAELWAWRINKFMEKYSQTKAVEKRLKRVEEYVLQKKKMRQ